MGKKKDPEQKLKELAFEMYESGPLDIAPLYPWVLVRILPKENKSDSGLLYLPERQNKILYEGIVLRTWKPHWRLYRRKDKEFERWETSQVAQGDLILFPHWLGTPVPWLNVHTHRLVKEVTEHDGTGGIQLKAKYGNWLPEHIRNMNGNDILDKYFVIPKEGLTPKTQSGA